MFASIKLLLAVLLHEPGRIAPVVGHKRLAPPQTRARLLVVGEEFSTRGATLHPRERCRRWNVVVRLRQVEEDRTQWIRDLARGIRSDCSVPSSVTNLVGRFVQGLKLDSDRDNGTFLQDVVLICQRRQFGYLRVLLGPDSCECVRESRLVREERFVPREVRWHALGLYPIRTGTKSDQADKWGQV